MLHGKFGMLDGTKKLLNIDIQGAPIEAVRDVHQSVQPRRELNEFKKTDWSNTAYFNAGVLLTDGANFLEENAFEMIENCAQKYPQALTTYDQSPLNTGYYENRLEPWNELAISYQSHARAIVR